MKTKRILAMFMVVVMLITMLPISTLALDVTDKVSEVELTIPEAKAGNTVNLDISSVEVKHHMTYKVVGIRWYKSGDDRQMGVESGADTYFIGGETYTVEIDLEDRLDRRLAGRHTRRVDERGDLPELLGARDHVQDSHRSPIPKIGYI